MSVLYEQHSTNMQEFTHQICFGLRGKKSEASSLVIVLVFFRTASCEVAIQATGSVGSASSP